jgi:hypothetical protein
MDERKPKSKSGGCTMTIFFRAFSRITDKTGQTAKP